MLLTSTILAAAIMVICVLAHHSPINLVNVGGVTRDVGSFTTSGCAAQIVERNREKILLVKAEHPRWSVAIYSSTGKRTYLYKDGGSV